MSMNISQDVADVVKLVPQAPKKAVIDFLKRFNVAEAVSVLSKMYNPPPPTPISEEFQTPVVKQPEPTFDEIMAMLLQFQEEFPDIEEEIARTILEDFNYNYREAVAGAHEMNRIFLEFNQDLSASSFPETVQPPIPPQPADPESEFFATVRAILPDVSDSKIKLALKSAGNDFSEALILLENGTEIPEPDGNFSFNDQNDQSFNQSFSQKPQSIANKYRKIPEKPVRSSKKKKGKKVVLDKFGGIMTFGEMEQNKGPKQNKKQKPKSGVDLSTGEVQLDSKKAQVAAMAFLVESLPSKSRSQISDALFAASGDPALALEILMRDDVSQDPVQTMLEIFPSHTREELGKALEDCDGDIELATVQIMEKDFTQPPVEDALYAVRPDLTTEEIRSTLNGLNCSNSQWWLALPSFSEDFASSQISVPRQISRPQIRRAPKQPETPKRVLTIDLHGMRADSCQAYVNQALLNARGSVKRINFITGKGIHSPGGVPVLRGLVLKTCKSHGLSAHLDSRNRGVVAVELD